MRNFLLLDDGREGQVTAGRRADLAAPRSGKPFQDRATGLRPGREGYSGQAQLAVRGRAGQAAALASRAGRGPANARTRPPAGARGSAGPPLTPPAPPGRPPPPPCPWPGPGPALTLPTGSTAL